MSAPMNHKQHGNEESWLAYLKEEYLLFEEGSVEHDVSSIIKRMEDQDRAARTAAHEIDDYWRSHLEPYTFNFQKVEPVFLDFHACLYNIILELPRFVHYNDPKQDTLVQFLVEFRRLPSKSDPPLNDDRLVNPDDSRFVEILDDCWRANSSANWEPRGDTQAEPVRKWEDACKEWVNFSSFIARCTEARIDDHFPDFTKYPSIDITEGLEKDTPSPGLKRDTKVMVAAQYILLAGRVLDEESIQEHPKIDGPPCTGEWQLWAGNLKKLAETELDPEVREAVVEARKKMISLRPELFAMTEGGSMPDV